MYHATEDYTLPLPYLKANPKIGVCTKSISNLLIVLIVFDSLRSNMSLEQIARCQRLICIIYKLNRMEKYMSMNS